jgi:phosphoribosylanthranilate isomerase
MWVKICGNTNLGDALKAAELGADAVGFIFAESKRRVTAAQVAAITAHLPAGVERVGVFESRDAAEIGEIAAEAGLTAVQLHGGLDERLIGQVPAGVQVIQTLHWVVGDHASGKRLAEQMQVAAAIGIEHVLVDSRVGAAAGGTGVAFDWAAARAVFEAAPSHLRLIVAGGLQPENVADAVHRLRPWGVDVSSGVEVSPGRKDPAQVARFIEKARGAQTP